MRSTLFIEKEHEREVTKVQSYSHVSRLEVHEKEVGGLYEENDLMIRAEMCKKTTEPMKTTERMSTT